MCIRDRSSGGPGEDNREVVPVVDEDGGPAAADLVAALAASETIRPEAYGRAEAEELLDGNDVGAILIIPAGFSDGLTAAGQAGDPAEIVVRSAPVSYTHLDVYKRQMVWLVELLLHV